MNTKLFFTLTAPRGKGALGREAATRLAGWVRQKLGRWRELARKLRRRDLDHAPGPIGFVP